MSDSIEAPSLIGLLAAAHTLVDLLQDVSLTCDTDDELLSGLRELERLHRRLDAVDYRLIHDAERRGLPAAHGAVTTGRWLRWLLRLDTHEANTRAAASAAAGPRTGLTGEPLEPVFAHVATGQAAGVVSQRQARLIEKTIDALPDEVAAEHGAALEADLVGYAADFDPQRLATLAARMVDHVHPDGTFLEPEQAQKRREFSLTCHRDGTATLGGLLTPELTERLLSVFDTLAAPKPAVDGIKDSRTPGQRQHDALLVLTETAVRTGDVPSNNGVSATLVLTMTTDQYLSGKGLARTGHGAVVPARDALTWGGGDTEVILVALNSMRAITHYSSTHRIVTEHQRRALAARDGGCTFPGCPELPGRCQADHVPRFEHSHRTRVDELGLACRYHHREAERLDWHPNIIDGLVHWVPPPWVDPTQTPIRNTLHDTTPAA